MEIGYSLSSEENTPTDLVRFANRAEDAGFSFVLISDHFHPWISRQGRSLPGALRIQIPTDRYSRG
jgi:alkanesulfonate monooxygenase SsuD/methylene tetrahydromethanopterin reductase-like flavin-dependent oxidoreductase (luciferase family)